MDPQGGAPRLAPQEDRGEERHPEAAEDDGDVHQGEGGAGGEGEGGEGGRALTILWLFPGEREQEISWHSWRKASHDGQAVTISGSF